MPIDSSDLPTGGAVVNAARDRIDDLTYKCYGYSNNTPSGVPKDHHFVADTLADAGIGFGSELPDRPGISDWANPQSNIPGWRTVGGGGAILPGDILATPKPIPLSSYHGGGQQLAVATGDGTSLGIVDNDRVGESDFGFRDGHAPMIWRSTQLAREPVEKEDLPPLPGTEGCPIGGPKPCPWGSRPNPNGKVPGDPNQIDPGILKPWVPVPGTRDPMPEIGGQGKFTPPPPIIRR